MVDTQGALKIFLGRDVLLEKKKNWPIHLPNLDPKLDPYINGDQEFAPILQFVCKIYVKFA